MSSIKYLCIDDQPEQYIQPLLNQITKQCDGLDFEKKFPKDFVEQLNYVIALKKGQKFFGLLLDLRLDMDASDDGEHVYYRGPALAQELRSRMAEGALEHFPIVLWSMSENITSSYKPDVASHDLFDAVYSKDGQDSLTTGDTASQLTSLVLGYDELGAHYSSTKFELHKILGVNKQELDCLDPRLLESLSKRPVYEMASKILNGLLRIDGPTVGEELLAARLGVDHKRSTDWITLLKKLSTCKYTGVFGSAWSRWWWHRVEEIWSEISPSKNLRKCTASERVDILNDNYSLALVPSLPIAEGCSDKFYSVCLATGKPIDTIDAFKAKAKSPCPWADLQYISAYAALKRLGRDRWSLDPLEVERFKALKEAKKNAKKDQA